MTLKINGTSSLIEITKRETKPLPPGEGKLTMYFQDNSMKIINSLGEVFVIADDINSVATGQEVDVAINNSKFITAKSLKDSHSIPSVVPGEWGQVLTSDGYNWVSATGDGGITVATGDEIDEGVDNLRVATPKALKDSSNIPFIAPGDEGNMMVSDGADWISVAGGKATGADIDTGTDDVKFVTPKTLKDSHNVPSVVPGDEGNAMVSDGMDWISVAGGQATGADIDTGTDNNKFATPKSLKDSHNVPSVVPSTSGNVLTSDGTDWVSSSPATGAEVDTGTVDNKFVTPKTLKDSHNVPSVVPSTSGNVMVSDGTDWASSTPATGAEVDTGTVDNKFVTPKSLKDSHNVPSVAPSTTGNVLTSDGTDWVSVPLALATGAEVDTATDNSKVVTAKALKDSHNVPSVVPSTSGKVMTSDGTDWISSTHTHPVKATGAELDTGTDDDKFATAKALVDSHNIPSVAPGTSGNVLTSDGTDWVSLVSSGEGGGGVTIATGLEVDDGTDNVKVTTPKALKDSHNVPSVAPSTTGNVLTSDGTDWISSTHAYPVKSIGSELDTGTDDDKFATALALKVSHNVPSVIPSTSGKVMTSDGTDWISSTHTHSLKAIGSELDTGTDDDKFATALALKVSHNVPSVVPDTSGNVLTSDGTDWISSTHTHSVKAIGSELDTGTDDDKFATALALKVSHNVPSVVPSTVGNVLTSNGTDWVSSAISAPSTYPCQGRLTLESGVPVSTTNQTAKATLYFTPFRGNRVSLYNGSGWIDYTFTERSLSLAGYLVNTNYDIFLYDNAGTLTLESAVFGTMSPTQDGIYVKSGAPTRRYLGTIRIGGVAGQTEDSNLNRFVWNYYNRLPRSMNATLAGASQPVSASVYAVIGNLAALYLNFVVGASEESIYVGLSATVRFATSTYRIGIGLNSTTVPTVHSLLYYSLATSYIQSPSVSNYSFTITRGFNYVAPLAMGPTTAGYISSSPSFSFSTIING